ncbi:MAG: phosphoribosylanthranilate isomerase, partial [Chloroflexi bacterium]|nr:phosphoribosylanthranilate isomerase [Chloroflexota bacterium]
RELQHLLVATEAGANLLGMVFVPGVRRRLEVEQAKKIAEGYRQRLGSKALPLVGLFSDQPQGEVNDIAKHVGLDRVQLCGEEPLDYCARMAKPPMKVVHIPSDLPAAEILAQVEPRLSALAASGYLAILDRHGDTQPGGLGQPFDWTVACELARRGHRFLLAGGLTPDNVAQAIEAVRPYGVDVSSGVETKGVKDEAKIQAFVREVSRIG